MVKEGIDEHNYRKMQNLMSFDFYCDKEFYNNIEGFKNDLIKLEKGVEVETIMNYWSKKLNKIKFKILGIPKNKNTIAYRRADKYKLVQLKKALDFASTIKKRKRVYFTLNDIVFKEDYFFLQSNVSIEIKCEGCIPVHNELKEELISKSGNNLYKVILDDNLRPDLTIFTDYKYITSFFYKNKYEEEVLLDDNEISSKSSLRKSIGLKEITTERELYKKNVYLKALYLKLRVNDKVFTIDEVNNDKEEKTLLFVFYRNKKVLFIWENENSNRASYFFLSRIENSSFLLRELTNIITSDILNKREKLIDIQDRISYLRKNIGFLSALRVVHTSLETYENKLYKFINTNDLKQ